MQSTAFLAVLLLASAFLCIATTSTTHHHPSSTITQGNKASFASLQHRTLPTHVTQPLDNHAAVSHLLVNLRGATSTSEPTKLNLGQRRTLIQGNVNAAGRALSQHGRDSPADIATATAAEATATTAVAAAAAVSQQHVSIMDLPGTHPALSNGGQTAAGATAGASLLQGPDSPLVNRTLMDSHMSLLKQSILMREKRLLSFPDSAGVLPLTYLAMCAVIKDDGKLLREWIQYHHDVLGIRRFYIFDNNSTYPAYAVAQLQGWIQAGVVVYEYFTYSSRAQGGKMPQHYAVDQCVRRWADHHEWMAFIDPDEFMVLRGPVPSTPPATNMLRKLQPKPLGPFELFLSGYEGAGGLSINVMTFSSSGRNKMPPGVIGYYKECAPDTAVKTIASMHFYLAPMIHPHNHLYLLGAVAVNEEGGHVTFSENSPPMTSRIVLYHYYLRSRQDWARKIKRGRADCEDCGARDWEWFNKVTKTVKRNYNTSQCLDLDHYKDMFTKSKYARSVNGLNQA